MRPLAAIVLAFLLFVSLFGFYMSFSIQRSVIRKQVSRYDKFEKGEEISRLVFTLAEYNALRKFDGGKEFSWQGNMYDVIERKAEGNRIVLTVYLDHKETSLIHKFLSVFEEETDGEEDDNTLSSTIDLPEYVSSESQFTFHVSESAFHLSQQASRTLTTDADILSPPPDTFV